MFPQELCLNFKQPAAQEWGGGQRSRRRSRGSLAFNCSNFFAAKFYCSCVLVFLGLQWVFLWASCKCLFFFIYVFNAFFFNIFFKNRERKENSWEWRENKEIFKSNFQIIIIALFVSLFSCNNCHSKLKWENKHLKHNNNIDDNSSSCRSGQWSSQHRLFSCTCDRQTFSGSWPEMVAAGSQLPLWLLLTGAAASESKSVMGLTEQR